MSIQLKQHGLRDVKDQEILAKIRQLNPQELTEVMDFIDFLIMRQPKRLPLVQLMSETSGPETELVELRRRLAKISGKMSDTVREIRDERG